MGRARADANGHSSAHGIIERGGHTMMHLYIIDEAFPVAESVNVVATERNLKKCFEPMYL